MRGFKVSGRSRGDHGPADRLSGHGGVSSNGAATRAQAAAGVHLRGGATAVTTAPGVAPALLKNGIVPLATWPGRQSVLSLNSGPAVRFTFPVTGAG